MSSAGVAPAFAPKNTVLGPFITSSGFRYWYLVCDSESIVVVPQSFLSGFWLVFSQGAGAPFGLLGFFLSSVGKRKHVKLLAELQAKPMARLKYAPNQVFTISGLRSIQGKASKLGSGGLFTSDIILEKTNGTKSPFGVKTQFDDFCAQLQKLYPTLFKRI